MPVSKHNLWKRKKNDTLRNTQWWDKPTRTSPVVSTKSVTSSTKRTQVGKKV